jgi:hypothetical protein
MGWTVGVDSPPILGVDQWYGWVPESASDACRTPPPYGGHGVACHEGYFMPPGCVCDNPRRGFAFYRAGLGAKRTTLPVRRAMETTP